MILAGLIFFFLYLVLFDLILTYTNPIQQLLIVLLFALVLRLILVDLLGVFI